MKKASNKKAPENQGLKIGVEPGRGKSNFLKGLKDIEGYIKGH
jgi:hypothetical protein